MGLFGGGIADFFHNPEKFFTHDVSQGAKDLVHNPEKALMSKNLRESPMWRNVGHPVEKIGGGALIGSLTGGLGVPGELFSLSGGLAGGLSSALDGGFDNSGFNFVRNGVIPGVAGYAVGTSTPGKVLDESVHQGLNLGDTLTNVGHAAWSLPFAGGGSSLFGNTSKWLSTLAMLRGGLGGGSGSSSPYPANGGSGGVSPYPASPLAGALAGSSGTGANSGGGTQGNGDLMSSFGAVRGVG